MSALARTTDARYTRDIDLATSELGTGAAVEELKALAAKDLGDFVTFNYASLQPIKAEDEYRQGFTVTFDVFLGAKRMRALSVDLVADEIDCGEPEVVTPADRIEVDGLVSFDYPVYPAERAIADKVCGIVERHKGRPSSRVKDLVDIVVYARNVAFAFSSLSSVLQKEFSVRKLGSQESFGLPPEWGAAQARQYAKFAGQTGIPAGFRDIRSTEILARRLIEPCLSGQAVYTVWNTETQTWD